jgi:hypothetical protein
MDQTRNGVIGLLEAVKDLKEFSLFFRDMTNWGEFTAAKSLVLLNVFSIKTRRLMQEVTWPIGTKGYK